MMPISAVRFSRLSQSRLAEPTAPAIRSDRDWRHNPSRPASDQIPTKHPSNWPQPPLTLRDATLRITPVGLTQNGASRQIIEALRDIRVAQVMYNPPLLKAVAPDVAVKFNAMAKLAKKHPLSPVELSKDPLAMASTSAALAERLSQMAKDPAHKANKGLFELGTIALTITARNYLCFTPPSPPKSLLFSAEQQSKPTNPFVWLSGVAATGLNAATGSILAAIFERVGKARVLDRKDDRYYYSNLIGYLSASLSGAFSAGWLVATLGGDFVGLDGILLTPVTAAATQIQGKYIYGIKEFKDLNLMSKLAIQKGMELGTFVSGAVDSAIEAGFTTVIGLSLRPATTAALHFTNILGWSSAFEKQLEAKKPTALDENLIELYKNDYKNAFKDFRKFITSRPKAFIDWLRGKGNQTSTVTEQYVTDLEQQAIQSGLECALEATDRAFQDIRREGVITTMGNYGVSASFNVMGLPSPQRTPIDMYKDRIRAYSGYLERRTGQYLSDIKPEFDDPGIPELYDLLHNRKNL